jgi:hypothetical protein
VKGEEFMNKKMKGDNTDSISFEEIKEAVELIIQDEEARDRFISGAKHIVKVESKYLFMMAAGLLMIFFGVFAFVGMVLFLINLVLFGMKVAHFTLEQNESFKTLLLDRDKHRFE